MPGVRGKTSQLQIRITEEQKAALKRLATEAGQTVSEFVLSRALPSEGDAVARAVEGLTAAGGRARAQFEELARILADTPAHRFQASLATLPLEGLSLIVRNQVAGLLEQTAHARQLDLPPWVRDVPPPPRPHFGWPLASLRPHQIRVTPVPFKRRLIFFDPSSPRGIPPPRATPDPPVGRDGQLLEQPKSTLVSLAADLAGQELKVEFYLLGGAVLFQAFRTRPPTAHVSGLFASGELVEAAARRLAERKKLPADWVPAAVTETLGGTKPDARADRYLDVAGLAAFAPPAEYVLAVKVAALRVDADARALDDVRYLLRALNLRSAAAALDIVSRYFGPRQLAPNTEPLLRGLLAG